MNFERQKVFDQVRLKESSITIIGSDEITYYLGLCSVGLGIGNITIISDNPHVELRSLEEKIKNLNPETNIETIPLKPESYLIGNPDILIDVTNDPKSKEKAKEFFNSNENIRSLYFASSNLTNATLLPIKRNNKSKKNIIKTNEYNFLENYGRYTQGTSTSAIIASVLLDEIRKDVNPLEDDHSLERKLNFNINSPNLFFCKTNPPFTRKYRDISLLIIGVGGIGTYSVLEAVRQNIRDIDIYDGDNIEDHNIARQIFYTGNIGKNKALTLKKVLKEEFNCSLSNVKAFPEYLTDKKQIRKKYDVIISGVDNWKARKLLNEIALTQKIPFINTAVKTFGGDLEIQDCLECKYPIEKFIEDENSGPKKASCLNLDSNVITNNCLIGTLAVAEIPHLLSNDYLSLQNKEFHYNSQYPDSKKFLVYSGEKHDNCQHRK